MAKLDDLFSKKKETAPILDLSKTTVKSREEFRKLLDKVPDYKMKAEKVRLDDVKIKDKKIKFKTGKRDFKAAKEPFAFPDPVPVEMRNLKMGDLISVPIDWRMLTTARPKTKIDEEYFTRIIEMGKLELKTATKDKRMYTMDPQIRKSKNKAGVVEQRVVSCAECGEEFCTGQFCVKYSYDCFTRIPEVSSTAVQKPTDASKDHKKKKIKRKSRTKSRSKKKSSGGRSKSPKKDFHKK